MPDYIYLLENRLSPHSKMPFARFETPPAMLA